MAALHRVRVRGFFLSFYSTVFSTFLSHHVYRYWQRTWLDGHTLSTIHHHSIPGRLISVPYSRILSVIVMMSLHQHSIMSPPESRMLINCAFHFAIVFICCGAEKSIFLLDVMGLLHRDSSITSSVKPRQVMAVMLQWTHPPATDALQQEAEPRDIYHPTMTHCCASSHMV